MFKQDCLNLYGPEGKQYETITIVNNDNSTHEFKNEMIDSLYVEMNLCDYTTDEAIGVVSYAGFEETLEAVYDIEEESIEDIQDKVLVKIVSYTGNIFDRSYFLTTGFALLTKSELQEIIRTICDNNKIEDEYPKTLSEMMNKYNFDTKEVIDILSQFILDEGIFDGGCTSCLVSIADSNCSKIFNTKYERESFF